VTTRSQSGRRGLFRSDAAAQGEDLGVRGGVVIGLGSISGAGQDAAIRPQDHGTDGNFTARRGGLGFVEGFVHRVLDHVGHHSRSAAGTCNNPLGVEAAALRRPQPRAAKIPRERRAPCRTTNRIAHGPVSCWIACVTLAVEAIPNVRAVVSSDVACTGGMAGLNRCRDVDKPLDFLLDGSSSLKDARCWIMVK
jgi:hypothetical protein